MSIEVQGADQLARLAKQLLEGAKELQKEPSEAIFRATKPVEAHITRSFAETLPKRGGLARRAAATKLTTRRRTSAKSAGVRIVGKGTVSLYRLNRGQIRHRKGGKIGAGKVQPTTPGAWDKPTEAAAPEVRQELVKTLDQIARKLERHK